MSHRDQEEEKKEDAASLKQAQEAREEFATLAVQVAGMWTRFDIPLERVITQVAGMVAKVWKEDQLANLADRQLQTLSEREAGRATIKFLERTREQAIKEAHSMLMQSNWTPLIPVIPVGWFKIEDLMTMAEHCGNQGRRNSKIDPSYIVTDGPKPDAPYWMIAVDDGVSALNLNMAVANQLIESEGRSTLDVTECIAIVTHTPVFSSPERVVRCSRSFVEPNHSPLSLLLHHNEMKPYLTDYGRRNADPNSGVASCKSRVTLEDVS